MTDDEESSVRINKRKSNKQEDSTKRRKIKKEKNPCSKMTITNTTVEVKQISRNYDDDNCESPVSKIKSLPSIKTRMSPNSLYNTVQQLTQDQQNAVIEMGFESILDMKVNIIPNKIGFFVADNYNYKKNQLVTESGSISISPVSVYDVFGIPIGDIDLSSLSEAADTHPTVSLWRNQYEALRGPNAGYISATEISSKILSSNESGLLFRLNFIMLFTSTMCMCYANGYSIVKLINYLADVADLKTINWCKYVVDCLVDSKKNWSGVDSYFSGPLTFLTVSFSLKIKSF